TDKLSEQELVAIISRPGFSTAEKVTEISGRGVGFDIVANRVRALGGSLEVHTDAGLGTSVSMRLPLTLAISRALLAKVEQETYAIPLTHVLETFSLSKPMLLESKGKPVVAIRDDLVARARWSTGASESCVWSGRACRARRAKGGAHRRPVRGTAGNRRQAVRR